ncbi:hypothetical protein NLO93_28365, partial [Pseudomonas savastanoi]|nr:hypothetical protein [Pseudomonas savastanoi]
DVQVIRGPNNRRTGQWHSEQGDLFSVEPVQTGFVVMPKRWVVVTTCNRNGLDLQSSSFSTGIDCVYSSQQTGIICE